jgi:hypothetical protein
MSLHIFLGQFSYKLLILWSLGALNPFFIININLLKRLRHFVIGQIEKKRIGVEEVSLE